MLMAEALPGHLSVDASRGTPSVPAIAEFLHIWDELRQITLTSTRGTFTWRLGAAGKYSSCDTYTAFFFGREFAPCTDEIWRSWAPLEIKIFTWLGVAGGFGRRIDWHAETYRALGNADFVAR